MPKKPSVFSDYSRYYDLLYQDKDYDAESAYIAATLSRFGVASGPLLEFGSGTGRHGRRLAGKGYTVHGIERSREMVSKARQGDGFSCEEGDVCTVELGRSFSAVLALFHVVSYQVTNEAARLIFRRAEAHLPSGGLFVFDVWYTPAVLSQRPSVRVKRVSDEELEITRIAEPVSYPNENRVDVGYTIFARSRDGQRTDFLQETHPMRHYSLPEIDLLADETGFTRLCSEEFLTGRSPDETTWGVCCVLRKG